MMKSWQRAFLAASIISTSVAPEYYGTDTYVELSGYLEDPNPYIEGNTAWKDALDPDAYRTESGLSDSARTGVAGIHHRHSLRHRIAYGSHGRGRRDGKTS